MYHGKEPIDDSWKTEASKRTDLSTVHFSNFVFPLFAFVHVHVSVFCLSCGSCLDSPLASLLTCCSLFAFCVTMQSSHPHRCRIKDRCSHPFLARLSVIPWRSPGLSHLLHLPCLHLCSGFAPKSPLPSWISWVILALLDSPTNNPSPCLLTYSSFCLLSRPLFGSLGYTVKALNSHSDLKLNDKFLLVFTCVGPCVISVCILRCSHWVFLTRSKFLLSVESVSKNWRLPTGVRDDMRYMSAAGSQSRYITVLYYTESIFFQKLSVTFFVVFLVWKSHFDKTATTATSTLVYLTASRLTVPSCISSSSVFCQRQLAAVTSYFCHNDNKLVMWYRDWLKMLWIRVGQGGTKSVQKGSSLFSLY